MNTTLKILSFIKAFIREMFDKEDFPLQDSNGLYETKYTHTHELRCPNCGHTSWALLDYTVIKCHVCFATYDNYGKLGLKLKTKEDEKHYKQEEHNGYYASGIKSGSFKLF